MDSAGDFCHRSGGFSRKHYFRSFVSEKQKAPGSIPQRRERFLQAGADLSAENGMGKNSEAYLQSLLDQSTVPKEQADKILALLRH